MHGQKCSNLIIAPAEDVDDLFLPFRKIVLQSLNVAGSIKELQALTENPVRKTVFDFDLTDMNNPETRKNVLTLMCSLHQEEADKERLKRLREVAHFNVFSTMGHVCKTPEEKKIVEKFCYRAMVLSSRNSIVMGPSDVPEGEFGSAIMFFGSLLNHSCDPNTYLFNYDNKFVTITNRPIKAGEQLFICYG